MKSASIPQLLMPIASLISSLQLAGRYSKSLLLLQVQPPKVVSIKILSQKHFVMLSFLPLQGPFLDGYNIAEQFWYATSFLFLVMESNIYSIRLLQSNQPWQQISDRFYLYFLQMLLE